MEKEAALVEQQRAFKGERETWEAQRKAADADLQLLANAREAIKGGKRLRALELLGITLDEVQDEYLAGVREPTTEESVERIVADRLAAEQKRLADEAAARAKAEEEGRSAEFNQRVATWKTDAEKAYAEKAAELDPAAFDGVTADQVWERAVKEHAATGKLPTQAESLALIEQDFLARVAKSKKFRPVEAAAPPPAKTEESTEKTARDRTPRVLTGRDAGSVPLRPKVARKKDAFERLEEAKRELKVS
jgi:hypothetical protein